MALLEQIKTNYGTIRITRDRHGDLTYYQNGCFHSQANRLGVSLCAYVHVIQEMVRQTHAHNILVVGCAGGTLATMVRKLGCKVTVVDINAVAFTIARRHFCLPDDVRCVRGDGIAYIRKTRKRYDAVVIDVFGSGNEVPHAFTTEKFFHSIKKILSPKGTMVMNVITRDDKDTRADIIVRHAQLAGMDVALYDWPGEVDRNSLIVAGAIQRLHVPSGREAASIKDDLRGLTRRQHARCKIHKRRS